MNCANHPEVPASAFCRECGKPMCEECQKPALGSIYCPEHLPVGAAPPFSPPKPPPPPGGYAGSPVHGPARIGKSGRGASYTAGIALYTRPPRLFPPPEYDSGAHPILALILGFIPGVGAIYNGQYAKGLIHAVVFGLLVSIA